MSPIGRFGRICRVAKNPLLRETDAERCQVAGAANDCKVPHLTSSCAVQRRSGMPYDTIPPPAGTDPYVLEHRRSHRFKFSFCLTHNDIGSLVNLSTSHCALANFEQPRDLWDGAVLVVSHAPHLVFLGG